MDEEEAGRGSAASASTDGLRTVLLGKDAQELRVVQAIAEMQLKDFPAALQTWRRLAAFTCHHCGAFDEAMAVYATQVFCVARGDGRRQAALCALEMKIEAVSYVDASIWRCFWSFTVYF